MSRLRNPRLQAAVLGLAVFVLVILWLTGVLGKWAGLVGFVVFLSLLFILALATRQNRPER